MVYHGRVTEVAVCTIIAKNYLPYVRVLMASVSQWVPGVARFVILVDRVDGHFDREAENFTIVSSEALSLPEPA